MANPKTVNAKKRVSMTSGGGKSPAELVRQSNRWRDNYNPLRGLIISKVILLLEQAERGDYAELQMVLRKIEKRYPILKGLKARRLAALKKLDWTVKIEDELPAGITEEQAKKQQQYLRSRYGLIRNLREAFSFLVMAEFRGFAILQKRYYQGGQNDGAVRELYWLPQRNFIRDGEFGDFYWNENSNFGVTKETLGEKNRIGGDELPLEDFVIRECDSPLYEIALIAFTNWAMGRKDWAAFVEVFGLPNSVVIMPANIPTGKEDEYRDSAEKVAEGVSGALPNGADVKFPTASVRGNAPFKEFCDAQNEDVVLAGTGGLLTMLTAPTGIGKGPSDEHGDAFDEIAQGDAKEISEIFNREFDEPELEVAFPNQPHVAYFELAAPDKSEEDTLKFKREAWKQFQQDGTVSDILANQTDLKQLTREVGVPVNEEYVDPYISVTQDGALVTGELLKDSEDDIIGAKPGEPVVGQVQTTVDDELTAETQRRGEGEELTKNRRGPRVKNNSRSTMADSQPASDQTVFKALANDLQPLRERFARIQEITDNEVWLQKMREFAADIDALKADLTADPATARALEALSANAFQEGFEQ